MSQRGENWLNSIWYGDSLGYLPLLPLSWIFRAASGLRRMLYRRGVLRSYRSTVSVIIVGNISVGGTGKTPLTMLLIRELQRRGFSPGIASRGYRGDVGSSPVLVHADSDPAAVGDEAVLLARRCACPVVVHPDRVAAVKMLEQQGVDVIIADDGLQHYRLARDIEIAVVDGTRGWGNGRLLPAGPLRELPERLASVHFVLLQTDDDDASLPVPAEDILHTAFSLKPSMVHRLDGSESRAVGAFEGKRVHAVAAIGHPERFFAMLAALGMDVTRHAFPDHAALTAADLTFSDSCDVIMTEKDVVKCCELAATNLWYLPVDAVIAESGTLSFMEEIEKRIRRHD